METEFVIKNLRSGDWYYFKSNKWNPSQGETYWSTDLYEAAKFTTYPEAEQRLKEGCEKEHWGGYFKIDKVFVNR